PAWERFQLVTGRLLRGAPAGSGKRGDKHTRRSARRTSGDRRWCAAGLRRPTSRVRGQTREPAAAAPPYRARVRRAIDCRRWGEGRICATNSRSQEFSTGIPALAHACRATSVPEANWSSQAPSPPISTIRAPRRPTYSTTAVAPSWFAANDLRLV